MRTAVDPPGSPGARPSGFPGAEPPDDPGARPPGGVGGDPDPDGLALLVAVAAGTLVGRLWPWLLPAALAVAGSLTVVLVAGWRRRGRAPWLRLGRAPWLRLGRGVWRGLAALGLLAATAAAGTAVRSDAARAALLPALAGRGGVVVAGRVAAEPSALPRGGWGIELAVDRVEHAGRAWRTAERAGLVLPAGQARAGRPAVGDRIVAAGRVAGTGAAGGGPLGQRRGVELRRVELLARLPARSPALVASERLRAAARRAALAHLPAERAGLLVGIALGDTSLLPGDVLASFKAAGLTHLVAVSGANVAIVLTAGLWPLLAAGGGRRAAAWAGAALLAGFVVLTRWEPSVLRAAVMGLLVLAGIASGRGPGARRALCLAAATLLLLDPALSASLGFALSVAATAGVLWLGPLVAGALPGWVPVRVREAAGVTLGAQAAAEPVLAAVLGRASLAALPANLLALPLAGPPMLLGLVAAVGGQLAPPLAAVACAVAEPFLAALLGLARWGAGLPGATVTLTGPARLVPALLSLLLLRLPAARRRSRPPPAGARAAAGAAVGWRR